MADPKLGTEKTHAGRAARLALWNRLFHGVPVDLEELSPHDLLGDPDWAEDRSSYAFLRACVVISTNARAAVRYALRPAILYWFSNVSDKHPGRSVRLQPTRAAAHLAEAIGTRMTWEEAVAMVGRRPVDYSAYIRVLEIVQVEYLAQWAKLFPDTEPVSLAPMFNPERRTRFAREWES